MYDSKVFSLTRSHVLFAGFFQYTEQITTSDTCTDRQHRCSDKNFQLLSLWFSTLCETLFLVLRTLLTYIIEQ